MTEKATPETLEILETDKVPNAIEKITDEITNRITETLNFLQTNIDSVSETERKELHNKVKSTVQELIFKSRKNLVELYKDLLYFAKVKYLPLDLLAVFSDKLITLLLNDRNTDTFENIIKSLIEIREVLLKLKDCRLSIEESMREKIVSDLFSSTSTEEGLTNFHASVDVPNSYQNSNSHSSMVSIQWNSEGKNASTQIMFGLHCRTQVCVDDPRMPGFQFALVPMNLTEAKRIASSLNLVVGKINQYNKKRKCDSTTTKDKETPKKKRKVNTKQSVYDKDVKE
jgi:hypothetical protein